MSLIVKGSNDSEEPRWTSSLGQNLEYTVSAHTYQFESLRGVYEGYEELLPLSPTYLMQLSEEEHHING